MHGQDDDQQDKHPEQAQEAAAPYAVQPAVAAQIRRAHV